MSEIWKAVPGFEGYYEVSNMGRVRSLDRITPTGGRGDITGRTCLRRGKVLSPAINKQRGGYRYVNLHAEGQQRQRRVCVLVAAAFLGPRPPGQETRHLNGNAQDDRAANLQYGTPKQNAEDRKLHGTHQQGEATPNARLTEADVRHILTSRIDADTLGLRYGVHPGHINNIRRGVRWAHVRV